MHRRPFLTIAAYTYLFAMLALLFMPLVARAQNPALSSTPPPGKLLVNVFQTTSGQNVYTYATGTATAAHAPGLDVKMWNDALAVDTYNTLDIGGGVKAPIGTRSVPTKPDVAKAVGNFARGVGGAALKTAGAVYAAGEVAKALWDLCNELGYNCSKGPTGEPIVTVPSASYCASSGGCTFYAWNDWANRGYAYLPTREKACIAAAPLYASTRSKTGVSCTYPGTGPYCSCTFSGGSDSGLLIWSKAMPQNLQEDSKTIADLESSIAAKSGWPSSTVLPTVVEQSVASGNPLPLPAPSQVTGPAVIPMVPTVTEFPDGSKTTVTPEKRLSFGQTSPTVTVTDGQTTTNTSPTGVTSTVSSGSSPTVLPQPQKVELETCGLPGKPACKIDETGTPAPVPATQYDAALDPFKQSTDEKRDVIAGTADKSFFSNWSMFFAAPAMVQCEPMVMPNYLGMSLGTLDPCPVAGGMREVMAYIWALGGLWLCLGMIKGVM